MKKSKFTEEQIAFALRMAETGTRVAEVCRKFGITEQTYYRWKRKYGGLGVSELRRLNRPHAVRITWMGSEPIPDPIIRNVQAFFLFYIASFFIGAVLLDSFQALMGSDIGVVSAASASASALSNVGPALGLLGPTQNYLDIVWPGKYLLAFLMILGRLEIFPVLLLFTRGFWKR